MIGKATVALFAASILASLACAQGGAPGRGPMAIGPGNSPGWSLMTPQERAEHRSKMMGFTNYDECVAYLKQHHQEMQARAKAKGQSLPHEPRLDFCNRLKPNPGSN